MTDKDIENVVENVRGKLSEKGKERGLDLAVEDQDYKLDEEWLFVCVTPRQPGIRVYDYAEILGLVEKDLRKEGIENVYLVPMLEE